MKIRFLKIAALALLACRIPFVAQAAENNLIAPDAKVQKLAGDFQVTEGPAADAEGNVFFTGKGVTVFNPSGEQIAHIPVEESWTANVCFGGPKRETLFITASKSLYSIKMRVHGVK